MWKCVCDLQGQSGNRVWFAFTVCAHRKVTINWQEPDSTVYTVLHAHTRRGGFGAETQTKPLSNRRLFTAHCPIMPTIRRVIAPFMWKHKTHTLCLRLHRLPSAGISPLRSRWQLIINRVLVMTRCSHIHSFQFWAAMLSSPRVEWALFSQRAAEGEGEM